MRKPREGRPLRPSEWAVFAALVLGPILLLRALWIARPAPPVSPTPPSASRAPGPSPGGGTGSTLEPTWRCPLDGFPVPDAVACPQRAGDAPFVLIVRRPTPARPDPFELVGVDPQSGRIAWRVALLTGGIAAPAAACVIGGTVVVALASGGVRAYERLTGRPAGALESPPAHGNMTVVGIDHGAATLAGPGVAVQVDARPIPGAPMTRLGDAYVAIAALPVGEVLGGGRGMAVVATGDRRVHAVLVPSGQTFWSAPLEEMGTTALVRMRYVLVGGTKLHVLDRETGRRLETRDPGSPVRRLDERSSYLYVLHGENHLTVLDLDTREHVGGASAAAHFDYGMGVDRVLDASGQLAVLNVGTCAPAGRRVLSGIGLTSGQARLRIEDDRLFVVRQPPGGAPELVSFQL